MEIDPSMHNIISYLTIWNYILKQLKSGTLLFLCHFMKCMMSYILLWKLQYLNPVYMWAQLKIWCFLFICIHACHAVDSSKCLL